MRSTKLAIVFVLFVAAIAVAASAQTTVFVAGNATGYFGGTAEMIVPLVPAIILNGPGTITVTYVSGTVDLGGVITGPNGVFWDQGNGTGQFPLQEAKGVGGGKVNNFGALFGVFVPASRVNHSGFTAIDGTKSATRVGIMPGGLFFIGAGKTFDVMQAGTLFLGINDAGRVGDNSGGFTVEVTGP